MSSDPAHWQQVWSTRDPAEVSWYQRTPSVSLRLLRQAGVGLGSPVIDVGAGASPLTAHLLALGAEVTVADIAAEALEKARLRLGDQAQRVTWRTADVTRDPLGGPYDLWHDRAVYHFLVDAGDRDAYRRALAAAVPPGGHAIVATFAPHGPETCSGLPVRRYGADELASSLGAEWHVVEHTREEHETPWGARQAFTYVLVRHAAAGAPAASGLALPG